MVPAYVVEQADRFLTALDSNRNGRIDAEERAGSPGDPFRDLLSVADADGDGAITLDELTREIFYRADLNKDAIVTPKELDAAVSSGLFGPPTTAHASEFPSPKADGHPPIG